MRNLLATLALSLSLPALAADVDQAAALEALKQPGAVLIDVRTPEEIEAGALPGARYIGFEDIGTKIAELAPDKQTPIVLYCRSGRRSGIAQDDLRARGYTNVQNAGGYTTLKPILDKP
ncbi:rhodanese-like domain-containing protein [Pseudomonas sp. PDM13]|uniref:rhodanese-like domain-containing protein n=1 Tax=Pseudomonas sp. PDM13 TaxID=2769255 RepID=UPI0021E0061F|nr:rhodanese-like domain-containing protein [Pseudomonas sp. PDM13]MCU9948703.1 rhodanese-like domain-containing protein [Pseudomonas sp. PDM13]